MTFPWTSPSKAFSLEPNSEQPTFRSSHPKGNAPSFFSGTAMRQSVSQYGITWEFDQQYEVGQYANGDWFVVGPVTITNITPESTTVPSTDPDGVAYDRVVNGTMMDAGGSEHGYDTYRSTKSTDSINKNYVDSLNVAPSHTGNPLSLTTGTVFSSVGLQGADMRPDGRPTLQDLALLTVVDEVPAVGAFRPNPYGPGNKRASWSEDMLDYTKLKNLAKPASTPDLSTVKRRVQRFYNEQNTTWTTRSIHADNNQKAYGRGIGHDLGEALLSAHLDYSDTDKRDLVVSLVQNGLDIYGRLLAGADQPGEGWSPNGGHNNGRKMPLIFAGLMMGDTNILAAADRENDHIRFQEDGQIFRVDQSYVDNPDYDAMYLSRHVGMPEWSFWGLRKSNKGDRNWGAGYRWIGSAMIPHALTAYLSDGGYEAWNYPVFFEYMDRFFDIGSPSGHGLPNGIGDFYTDMWTLYRDQYGVTLPQWDNTEFKT